MNGGEHSTRPKEDSSLPPEYGEVRHRIHSMQNQKGRDVKLHATT